MLRQFEDGLTPLDCILRCIDPLWPVIIPLKSTMLVNTASSNALVEESKGGKRWVPLDDTRAAFSRTC